MEDVHTSQQIDDEVRFEPYLNHEQQWLQLRAERELKQIEW